MQGYLVDHEQDCVLSSSLGQIGLGPGQLDEMDGNPVHGREVGTQWSLRSLQTQTIIWFYDYVILWFYDCHPPWGTLRAAQKQSIKGPGDAYCWKKSSYWNALLDQSLWTLSTNSQISLCHVALDSNLYSLFLLRAIIRKSLCIK